MNSLAQFKRGDTLSLTATYKVAGVASSLIGMTVSAQIRQVYGLSLVDNCTITVLDQTAYVGQFVITPVTADTSTWPIGSLVCDIKMSAAGVVKHSDSFLIPVVDRVTI